MKKIIVLILTVAAAFVFLRPYVAVSWDKWGFALSTRTTVHEKFAPVVLLPAK